MRLKSLKLSGFKSFVDPIQVDFPGIMCGIVGPNGCGKSNIVEAIRFGLGEVSAKQLRGKEIDDLIFNGTDNRPSWNIAEVGLFVNIEGSDFENKFESKQLEIARKIWRGEGTNSFINGKEVRLKDIQLLFADASTSARSTSIVSQGRIGAITQAKPEDRKMVLEEAAGILGLQSRRHDAELRLKGANNNLLRVEDVIETYEEQLAILKKQAKEAERFRNISTLIKNAEASVFFVKRNDLQLIIEKLNEEKDKINIKLADFQGDVSIQDQAYEDLKVKIPPMREKSYSLNSELDRLNMTVENLKQEELRFEEHKINLEHRVKQLNQDLQIEQKQFEDTNNKIKTIKKDIEDLSSKEFEAENRDNPINQSDKSLLNNISFDKKYENAVAAIFGKELLASLEPDDIYYWSEHLGENVTKKFNFNCELASNVIKAPNQVINKLENVAIVSTKKEGTENHSKIDIGQAIVDLEGNLWRWDGLFISSSYEANISTILSELKEKRLNDLKKQIIEWERILEVTNQKTEDLNQRIKTTKEELEVSENNPGDIDSKRQFLLNKINQLDGEKKLFDNELQEQENLLEKLSKELRSKEQNYSVVKEELIRKESEISNYSNNLAQLTQSCREKINVDLLNLENEVEKFKKDEDLETAEKRVSRLNAERERIGAVNLLAEDEYVKLREKVDETIKDKNEIQESIEKLHEAINKINKEGVTRLKDAFKIVNENFERLFTKLFGGGKAYLKLIQNDEDPLNSGLEIFASPPGKKMQNITLLSGGEQALTAISLLFAVFMANPSPFCILDEVDAPLDDNNVDRFCSMVEEISEKVQTKFIIITHNRMTMSRVDRLYGVTMPEEGISQIVSVELEEAVKYAE